MAFFTRFCKSANLIGLLLTGLLFFTQVLHAAEQNHITIKSAELIEQGEQYVLNMQATYDFGNNLEEALNKGVALNFLMEFQLTEPRRYWFDDEIVTKSTGFTLSYHALSRQYLVVINKHQETYTSLNDAIQAITNLQGWTVFNSDIIDKNSRYQAALRIRLDGSKLSKALQIESIGSGEWSMVSQRYRWVPHFSVK